MNQPLNPVGLYGDSYSNIATCCCCNSKAYPGNPVEHVRSYFFVNIWFGALIFLFPSRFTIICLLLNLAVSITGYIMAAQTQNASLVKIFVIVTLVLNLIGMQIIGTVAFIFFFVACVLTFGFGQGIFDLLKDMVPKEAMT